METMTSRERWMAALRSQPLDRLPFWPKFDPSYAQHQGAPFRGMGIAELHRYVGSDPHIFGPTCVREVRRRTRVETSCEGAQRVTLFSTPRATLRFVERYDGASGSYHPVEFPVKSLADVDTLREVFEDTQVALDPAGLEKARRAVAAMGEGGIVAVSIGISPLMDWLQHLAGLENGLLWLADEPGRVEALFDAVHRVLLGKAEILAAEAPQELIYSVENTSTSLISPALFRRYCLGHLQAYGEVVRAAGKVHALHMCGKLLRLLPDIAPLPAGAMEAFTSAPVGDTSLAQGRAALPGKCLIGGTNATLWLEPAAQITATLERDLAALPHHRGVVVTSAGVMPPACRPETIREVCAWVREYPVA